MPIVLARVDNRLVHGQILSNWVPALSVDALLVADDEASHNDLVRSAMEIAMPPGLRLEVTAVEDAAAAARALDGARTVVLLRDVTDALRALRGGLRPQQLNVGNVHFSADRALVTPSVYLSADELAVLEQVEAAGVPVELRTLPRDAPLTLADIRKRMPAGSPR